jgi:hypothetical protein
MKYVPFSPENLVQSALIDISDTFRVCHLFPECLLLSSLLTITSTRALAKAAAMVIPRKALHFHTRNRTARHRAISVY